MEENALKYWADKDFNKLAETLKNMKALASTDKK